MNNTDPTPPPYNASSVPSLVRYGTTPGQYNETASGDEHNTVYTYVYGPGGWVGGRWVVGCLADSRPAPQPVQGLLQGPGVNHHPPPFPSLTPLRRCRQHHVSWGVTCSMCIMAFSL